MNSQGGRNRSGSLSRRLGTLPHGGGRGLTAEEIARIIEQQGGVCLVCQEVPRRWDIDHDHGCKFCGGKSGCRRCFRGMICSACNSMLGYARDNENTLLRGVAYLRSWRSKR